MAAARKSKPRARTRKRAKRSSARLPVVESFESSGSVEHSVCEPPPVQPCKLPGTPIFRTQQLARVIASLEFTRLEHAPPALT